MPPKYSDEDVDDLDDILDEFSELPPPTSAPQSSKPSPQSATTNNKGKSPDVTADNSNSNDDDTASSDDFAKEFAKQMEEMMRTLASAEHTSSSTTTGETARGTSNDEDEAKKFKELWEKMIIEDLEADPKAPPAAVPPLDLHEGSRSQSTSGGTTEDPFQRAIREAMGKLQTSESELRNQSGTNSNTSSNDNSTLETLLSSLGDLNLEDGEGENLESVLEGMMTQLMSKEILYEPLKELHDKFPQYLRENAKELSEDDKKRYEEQYQCVDKIIHTFDDPSYDDNDPKYSTVILEYMNVMQNHGSPPAAIMGDMPPGFDLDQDGLPKVPDGCIIT